MKEKNLEKDNKIEKIEKKDIAVETGRIKSICKLFEIKDTPTAKGVKRLGNTPKKITDKTEKKTPVSRKKAKKKTKDLIHYHQRSLMDLWLRKEKDL